MPKALFGAIHLNRPDDVGERVPSGTILSIDLGASFVKSGLVDRGQSVARCLVAPVDSAGSPNAILATIANVMQTQRESALGGTPLGVAVAVSGTFDCAAGVGHYSPGEKYSALSGRDLAKDLAAYSEVPPSRIVFVNDADAALYAELKTGPVRREGRRVLGVTLGTDLGLAFAVNGVIVPTTAWRDISTPLRGDVSASASDFSRTDLQNRLNAATGSEGRIADYAGLARLGDATVRSVFARFGADLARFLAAHIPVLRLDAVVVSGGLAGAFDLFEDAFRTATPIPVMKSAYAAVAGVVGAAVSWK